MSDRTKNVKFRQDPSSSPPHPSSRSSRDSSVSDRSSRSSHSDHASPPHTANQAASLGPLLEALEFARKQTEEWKEKARALDQELASKHKALKASEAIVTALTTSNSELRRDGDKLRATVAQLKSEQQDQADFDQELKDLRKELETTRRERDKTLRALEELGGNGAGLAPRERPTVVRSTSRKGKEPLRDADRDKERRRPKDRDRQQAKEEKGQRHKEAERHEKENAEREKAKLAKRFSRNTDSDGSSTGASATVVPSRTRQQNVAYMECQPPMSPTRSFPVHSTSVQQPPTYTTLHEPEYSNVPRSVYTSVSVGYPTPAVYAPEPTTNQYGTEPGDYVAHPLPRERSRRS